MSDTDILVRLAERTALLEATVASHEARISAFERASMEHEQATRREMAAQIEQLQGIIRDDTARQAVKA